MQGNLVLGGIMSVQKQRKEFNVSRNNWLNAKNEVFLNEKKRCNKAYKKAINSAIRSYYKDLHTRLRVLKSKNPKEYWSIINKSDNCQNVINQISCSHSLSTLKNCSLFKMVVVIVLVLMSSITLMLALSMTQSQKKRLRNV